jgi:hypothetical protein
MRCALCMLEHLPRLREPLPTLPDTAHKQALIGPPVAPHVLQFELHPFGANTIRVVEDRGPHISLLGRRALAPDSVAPHMCARRCRLRHVRLRSGCSGCSGRRGVMRGYNALGEGRGSQAASAEVALDVLRNAGGIVKICLASRASDPLRDTVHLPPLAFRSAAERATR